MRNPGHRLAHRLLGRILPQDSKLGDWLDFVDMPIFEIAEKLVDEMDEAGIDLCVPLMMDMAYCRKYEGSTKSFKDQMTETVAAVEAVNKRYNRIRMLPFIAADPNREDIVTIAKDALRKGAFRGVKIYPVMGFTPDDNRLYPIYEYCAANNIPVTTHCQNGGIPGLKEYYHLADPKHWSAVLEEFPALTLNLAHNDRTGSAWQAKITQLIEAYRNVYTDVSFNTEMWFMPRRYFRNIKRMLNTPKIQDRLLYGTDWFMGRCFWTEQSYLKWFSEYSKRIFWCRVEFTEEEIRRLTEDNPKRFLGL
jgi:predicted TIM-barrel fold metal-dependent hydrolase